MLRAVFHFKESRTISAHQFLPAAAAGKIGARFIIPDPGHSLVPTLLETAAGQRVAEFANHQARIETTIRVDMESGVSCAAGIHLIRIQGTAEAIHELAPSSDHFGVGKLAGDGLLGSDPPIQGGAISRQGRENLGVEPETDPVALGYFSHGG